uniref:Reverse transcriptase zinc-binding domain-containing protein n=1 Tax=Cannabis sativa TaxID=3483 RepID=A0A803PL57_CANSA
MEDQLHSSTSDTHRDWWKFFWSLNLPPKIRIFAWKVLQNVVPVVAALFKKKIIDSAACSLCPSSWESIGHVLFGCHHAKAVWKDSKFTIDFHKAQSMYNGETNRNKVFHGGKPRLSSSIIAYTTCFYNDYNRAKKSSKPAAATDQILNNQSSMNSALQQQVPWSFPSINVLKLNVDATTNLEQKKLGIGAIIRDHDGMVVAGFSKVVQGSFRSDEMEAKSFFHVLNWVSQLQLSITHIEIAALRVSTALNSPSSDLSCFSDLIFDVRCMLSFSL